MTGPKTPSKYSAAPDEISVKSIPDGASTAARNESEGHDDHEDLRCDGERAVGSQPPERALGDRAAVGGRVGPVCGSRPLKAGGGLLRYVRQGPVAQRRCRCFLGTRRGEYRWGGDGGSGQRRRTGRG